MTEKTRRDREDAMSDDEYDEYLIHGNPNAPRPRGALHGPSIVISEPGARDLESAGPRLVVLRDVAGVDLRTFADAHQGRITVLIEGRRDSVRFYDWDGEEVTADGLRVFRERGGIET